MALSKFLDPKNDVAFKRIFGSEDNKNILIRFINDILGLKGAEEVKSVQFLSPVQDPEISCKKQSVVDVLCKDQSGVQFIVEMQVAPQVGFEKRAQYYASKAYSRQLNKGQRDDGKYYNLKEVVFIAITDYVVFPNKKDYKSDHVILDKKTYEHDLKDFSFTFIELPKFKKDKVEQLETIVEKWCYFFKHADETSEADMKKIIEGDEVIEHAYEALNQFNWNEQELLLYEQERKRVLDNYNAELYVIEQAERKGMEKGMEKGKKEGLEEGMEKGLEKGKLAIAKNMLLQKFDLDTISAVTGLSLKDLQELLK
ncbi:MAG TPA: Rpn family recombination-promoting nuclease/putative transposase [Candidatus Megaira endosymbiont of Nemacystus decipiens]|nr:Rpn family recombination-promoting nuclease/putative transposase [Candidatus Megaera endosymbiont of Nemacystus decipiens]